MANKITPLNEQLNILLGYMNDSYDLKSEDLDLHIGMGHTSEIDEECVVIDALVEQVVLAYNRRLKDDSKENEAKFLRACKVVDDYCEVRSIAYELTCTIQDPKGKIEAVKISKDTGKVVSADL